MQFGLRVLARAHGLTLYGRVRTLCVPNGANTNFTAMRDLISANCFCVNPSVAFFNNLPP